jgi:hypothetical protein
MSLIELLKHASVEGIAELGLVGWLRAAGLLGLLALVPSALGLVVTLRNAIRRRCNVGPLLWGALGLLFGLVGTVLSLAEGKQKIAALGGALCCGGEVVIASGALVPLIIACSGFVVLAVGIGITGVLERSASHKANGSGKPAVPAQSL